LDSVLTDLMGKSGRAIIEALIAGETNPVKLAGLADRRVKASPEEFREALRGRVTKHHRFLLRLHLNQIDALDAAMATLDAQVKANLGPFRIAVKLIGSIPGIKNLGAHVIVSEIGIDMSRFASAAHLISWACICPRNDESAGKRRSNRLRKGGTWLKTTLVQCAWAAVKKKDSYLQAQFYRIKARSSEPRSLNAGGIPHPHSRKYEVESAYRARRLSNHLHYACPPPTVSGRAGSTSPPTSSPGVSSMSVPISWSRDCCSGPHPRDRKSASSMREICPPEGRLA
jgi:hypothetical protein